jgi:hypothetical protein
VAGRLVQTFARNLSTMLEGGPAPAAPAPAPAAEAEAPVAEPGAPPAETAPSREEALDLGSLGGAMITDRLKDPRGLAGLVGLVALVAFLLGRRSAR